MAGEWLYTLEYGTESFELEERELVAGRSRRCDLVVQEPSVSRRHVSLIPSDGKVLVQDLGSSNGTFVNGRRLKAPSELSDGDTLKLGDAELGASIRQVAQLSSEASPEVGEATHFLQVASVRLAQETLGETSEAGTPSQEPPAAETASTARERDPMPSPHGAHVAPPRPENEAEKAAAEARSTPPPVDPLATTALPVDEPLPASDARDPGESGAGNPLATTAMPASVLAKLAGEPPAAAPEFNPLATTALPAGEMPPAPVDPETVVPEANPLATTAMPVEELMAAAAASLEAPESADREIDASAVEPLPLELPSPETFAPEPPHPETFAPEPPSPARTHEDEPSATPPAENARDEVDLLPSLEGFDLTLGPGVPVPPAMEQARENVEREQERAPTTEAVDMRQLYRPPEQTPPLASVPLRVLAFVLDGLWIGALAVAASTLGDATWQLAAAAVGLLVVLFGWAFPGTTPGKRLLKLYVYAGGRTGVGLPRAFLRLVGYLLSTALLGLGFLFALSASRQALHDRIAGTHVRRRD